MADDPLPDTEAAALLALCEAATEGPWTWRDSDGLDKADAIVAGKRVILDLGVEPDEPYYGGRSGKEPSDADLALILAASRSALPRALRSLAYERHRLAKIRTPLGRGDVEGARALLGLGGPG